MLNPQMKGWGIYELYRRQAEALEQSTAPPPSPPDKPVAERHYHMRPDGTFEMLADSDPRLAFNEEKQRFARLTAERRATANEVAEHEAKLAALAQKCKNAAAASRR